MKGHIYLVLFLLFSMNAFAEIIIVNESQKEFYSLELVKLTGDLTANLLDVSGNGEIIAGNNVKVYLFGPAEDIALTDVELNGEKVPVSFDNNGYFLVVPAEGRFAFAGKMAIRKIGQLQLYVPGPMNQLEFALEHGYAVSGDQYGVHDKTITIQRSEKAAMLVDGNFRFSYAERNSFYYVIHFKSFGSTLGSYTIKLPNNEQVLEVRGVLRWQQQGSDLLLELEGSEATVSVSGIFSSGQLKVPLNEGISHVLIESDAEKKITVSTNAREVDMSESPLPANYPNARAFIAKPHDIFDITVKQLTVLPSLAASVKSATSRIAINDKGSIVGELSYNYANTGVDYIEMDVPGTPLYAAASNGPVKLTKDDKFLLTFPKTGSYGNGELDLVYFTTVPKLGLFDLITVPLAKTDLPISQQTTQVFLPKEYFVIETFGAKGGSELPGLKNILLFMMVVAGLSLLLVRSIRFSILYVIFSAGLYLFDYRLFFLLVAVTIFFAVKRHLAGKGWWKWVLAGAGGLVVVGLLVFIAASFLFMSGEKSMSTANYRYADDAMVQEAPMPLMKSMQVLDEESDGAITVPTRTGVLPVKLELPRLGKQITVTNYLVTKENPVDLKVWIVASWLVYIYYALAFFAGLLAFRIYAKEHDKDRKA